MPIRILTHVEFNIVWLSGLVAWGHWHRVNGGGHLSFLINFAGLESSISIWNLHCDYLKFVSEGWGWVHDFACYYVVGDPIMGILVEILIGIVIGILFGGF